MSAVAHAKLTVSFGLVSIPVKVHSAEEPDIKFNMISKSGDTGERVTQQYHARGKAVQRTETVKGFEFMKDHYVTFTPDEIKSFEDEADNALEVKEFVPLRSIDPIFFSKTYYLSPDTGAAKPYALMAAALRKSGKAAIGRWSAARSKSRIASVRAKGGLLVMQLLHYGTDIRQEVQIRQTEVNPDELDIALQFVERATLTFSPDRHPDMRRERIQAAIDSKINRNLIIVSGNAKKLPPGKGAQVMDLMAALRGSLKQTKALKKPSKKGK